MLSFSCKKSTIHWLEIDFRLLKTASNDENYEFGTSPGTIHAPKSSHRTWRIWTRSMEWAARRSSIGLHRSCDLARIWIAGQAPGSIRRAVTHRPLRAVTLDERGQDSPTAYSRNRDALKPRPKKDSDSGRAPMV